MTELNTQQEDLVLDQQRDMVNEIDDGAMDSWIHNHHLDLVNEYIEENSDGFKEYYLDLVNEYIEENSDGFKEYCKNRWDEVTE